AGDDLDPEDDAADLARKPAIFPGLLPGETADQFPRPWRLLYLVREAVLKRRGRAEGQAGLEVPALKPMTGLWALQIFAPPLGEDHLAVEADRDVAQFRPALQLGARSAFGGHIPEADDKRIVEGDNGLLVWRKGHALDPSAIVRPCQQALPRRHGR